MPKLRIVKSIIINAPVEKIYTYLNNFNHWLAWSPWLIMEPDANVTIAGDARSYSWSGHRVGEGSMSIVSEDKHKQVTYDLNFVKPWKSKAKVSFMLDAENDDGIKLTWVMDSRLPFFLFWMKKMMVAYVGMDYERGLMMLKEVIEDGAIKSKLEFRGKTDFPATQYIGIRHQCSTDEIGEAMGADFAKLEKYIEASPDLKGAKVFSIYHKWDILKKMVDYTAGVSISTPPSRLPADITVGNIPATRIYTLRHIGAYEHLENAWTTLYNMQRNKEFKCEKGIRPFEVYVNSPKDVAEKDLITDINLALN